MFMWLGALYQCFVVPRINKRHVAGQGLVEYALILVFVAIVVMVILATVGNTICTNWYSKLMNNSVFGGGGSVSCGS